VAELGSSPFVRGEEESLIRAENIPAKGRKREGGKKKKKSRRRKSGERVSEFEEKKTRKTETESGQNPFSSLHARMVERKRRDRCPR